LTRAAGNGGWFSGPLLRIAESASCALWRFILVSRLLLPPALQADPTFWTRQKKETAFRCFAM
jgi:hypothetical protein